MRDPNDRPAPPAPPNRFDCAECGQSVKADEDGCCSSCGRDCTAFIDGKQIATSAPAPGLDSFMADRGYPYMTQSEVVTAEAEFSAPAPGLDLEAIEKLRDLWDAWGQGSMIGMDDVINAIRPALDEVRALRARLAESTAAAVALAAEAEGLRAEVADMTSKHDHALGFAAVIRDDRDRWNASWKEWDAKLTEAKQLGMEACALAKGMTDLSRDSGGDDEIAAIAAKLEAL